jgi:transposase-like protein
VSDPVPVSSPVPTHPAERKQFWRDAISAFPSSGLSVREFCRQHGLHEKRFYTWRKHLGLSPVARPSPTTSTAAPSVPGFMPVRLVADTAAEVVLPGGVVVRVPVSSDPAHVARLVAALRSTPC